MKQTVQQGLNDDTDEFTFNETHEGHLCQSMEQRNISLCTSIYNAAPSF